MKERERARERERERMCDTLKDTRQTSYHILNIPVCLMVKSLVHGRAHSALCVYYVSLFQGET